MINITHDGVYYRVHSDNADDLYNNLPAIRADIRTMMDTQTGDIKWFKREDRMKWNVLHIHGQTFVNVFGEEGVEKKVKKKKKLTEEANVSSYCLLVEMGNYSWSNYTPQGFAIFKPGAGGTLNLAGFTNSMVENIYDPPGPNGQDTFRVMWCKHGWKWTYILPMEVEQIRRVDGNWHAYVGDSEEEECTELYYTSDSWSYEGIPYVNYWESVDPGPPDPDFCGYTWDIHSNYGGPGAAEYHDVRHLFYMVKVGDQILEWWPPYFTQLIVRRQYWYRNSFLYPAKDYDDLGWDWADQNGFLQELGHIMPDNSYSKADTLYDWTTRFWGIVWGTIYFPLEDMVVEPMSPPYTDYHAIPGWWVVTALTPLYYSWLDYDGCYVAGDRWNELFIAGVMTQSGVVLSEDYIHVDDRPEVDPDEKFIHPDEDLDETQLEILQGNDGDQDDTIYTRDMGEFCVLAGGEVHTVKARDYYGQVALVYDCGIFTKENTGINQAGEVDVDTIDPVYVFSMDIDQVIYYGLIIDGECYISDGFDRIDAGKYDIPGLEEAYNSANERIYCNYKVRAGITRTNIKSEVEFDA